MWREDEAEISGTGKSLPSYRSGQRQVDLLKCTANKSRALIENQYQAAGMRVFKNALDPKHQGITGISLGLLFRLMAARLQGSSSTSTSTATHHTSTQSDGPCTSKHLKVQLTPGCGRGRPPLVMMRPQVSRRHNTSPPTTRTCSIEISRRFKIDIE